MARDLWPFLTRSGVRLSSYIVISSSDVSGKKLIWETGDFPH